MASLANAPIETLRATVRELMFNGATAVQAGFGQHGFIDTANHVELRYLYNNLAENAQVMALNNAAVAAIGHADIARSEAIKYRNLFLTTLGLTTLGVLTKVGYDYFPFSENSVDASSTLKSNPDSAPINKEQEQALSTSKGLLSKCEGDRLVLERDLEKYTNIYNECTKGKSELAKKYDTCESIAKRMDTTNKKLIDVNKEFDDLLVKCSVAYQNCKGKTIE